MKKGLLKTVSAIAIATFLMVACVMPKAVLASANAGNPAPAAPGTGVPLAVLPVAFIMIASGVLAIRTLKNNEED